MDTDNRIAVMGLGYVGLPLAIGLLEAGCEVVGVDASSDRVTELLAGHSPIDDIDDERLRAALAAGLMVTTDADADLARADVIIVCVPTPITKSKAPDLQAVLDAATRIAATLRTGQLVVLQSTTYPGTTSGPFRDALERSGSRAGRDFDLAYAPERMNPGDPASGSAAVPRLVGGYTPSAAQRAGVVFRRLRGEVLELSSPDAAEMAKLLENVFRNVNIALVNQLALLCERMGLDVWEVTAAAATKPFGFMPFYPGPGVGGHCIPIDPYYLAWRAREFDFIDRFVELAGDVNLGMPRHVVDLVVEALNEHGKPVRGARVGIVGVAFKADVRDARNAPAADVMAGLAARGAILSYHDPHVARFHSSDGSSFESVTLPTLLDEVDIVVVVTAHRAIDWAALYARAPIVVDTTNSSQHQVRRDHQVLRLGAGWASARGPA